MLVGVCCSGLGLEFVMKRYCGSTWWDACDQRWCALTSNYLSCRGAFPRNGKGQEEEEACFKNRECISDRHSHPNDPWDYGAMPSNFTGSHQIPNQVEVPGTDVAVAL